MNDMDEQTQHELAYATKIHDHSRQRHADLVKASQETANIAIKSLIFINGGAVVALLALIGALERGDASNALSSSSLIGAINWFAQGVGLAAVVAFMAYLVTVIDMSLEARVILKWEHPYTEIRKPQRWLGWLRNGLFLFALTLAAVALWFFFQGVFSVTGAVTALPRSYCTFLSVYLV